MRIGARGNKSWRGNKMVSEKHQRKMTDIIDNKNMKSRSCSENYIIVNLYL
jgi:hypothetical protein